MQFDVPQLGSIPLQERDLLSRLTQYFDTLDSRIREGQGWLIFGATGQREERARRFISSQLARFRPLYSYYLAPWRDFALNAYMEIELPRHEGLVTLPEGAPQRVELDIANRVSRDTFYWLLHCDVLVLLGFRPSHFHEATYALRVAETRYERRRPTIVLTPRRPGELEADFRALDASGALWSTFYSRAYERSLIAV